MPDHLRHAGVIATLPKAHPSYPGSGGGVICDEENPQRLVFVEASNLDRITCPKCAVLAVVMLANGMRPKKDEPHDEFRKRLKSVLG